MTTVCIIGAGDIGGAAAQALARGERVSRVLLIDADGKVAAGKALDIQQSGAVDRFHVRLDGTDDVSRVAGCAVCVVADRFGRPSSRMAGRGRPGDADAARVVRGRCADRVRGRLAGRAAARARARGTRPTRAARRLLPEALIAAVRAMVAMEASCSPSEVDLTVLGTPPAGFVVPWSEASIGGYSLERVLSQVQLTRIEARVGASVAAWPVCAGARGGARRRSARSPVAARVQRADGARRGVRGAGPRRRDAGASVAVGNHSDARAHAEHPRARSARNRARGVIGSITCEMPSRPWDSSSSASQSLGGDKEIEPDALLGHIKFLSSDELKGRGNGSEGLERAADYIAEQFKAAGLQPGVAGGWFQPFELEAGLIVGPDNRISFEYRGRSIDLALVSGYYPLAATGSDRTPSVKLDRSAAGVRRLRALRFPSSATTTTRASTSPARPSSSSLTSRRSTRRTAG